MTTRWPTADPAERATAGASADAFAVRGAFRVAAVWAALLAPWSAQAQTQTQTHVQAGGNEVERGRALYMRNGCYSCHGTVGQGGERSGAPKLAPEPYPYEAFRVLVRTPREAMPRFDVQYLSDEQLQLIHRYLASIARGPSAQQIPALRR